MPDDSAGNEDEARGEERSTERWHLQTANPKNSQRTPREIGNRKSKFENSGPDWARTSDPALIKRML